MRGGFLEGVEPLRRSDGQVGQVGVSQGGRQVETSEAGTCKSPKQERAWFVEGVKEVRIDPHLCTSVHVLFCTLRLPLQDMKG